MHMNENERKKREPPISYRPPAKLRDEFLARVEKSGLTTCAYITKCCLDIDPPRQSRRPAIEAQVLGRLLAELSALRDELHAANSAGERDTVLHEQAVALLSDIRDAVLDRANR